MKLSEPIVLVSLKNILLVTDLSNGSVRALQYAQAFASGHAAVHTLHLSGADNCSFCGPEAFASNIQYAEEQSLGDYQLRTDAGNTCDADHSRVYQINPE